MTAETGAEGLRAAMRGQGDLTLRKLQVFWAVAHAGTLTRAAKLMGVSQPSLSQLLSAFEGAVGARLFDRRPGQMVLTEAGRALLPQAEAVLRSFQALEDGLAEFAQSRGPRVRVAGVASVMRALLPRALAAMDTAGAEFDLHEAAPAEILDLLGARRVTVGLVAAATVTGGEEYVQAPVFQDPYVLAVPQGLDLGRDSGPGRKIIQFVFGNRHSAQVQEWCDRVLPGNRVVARARSFELAVEMVRAGLGVAVVPALCAGDGAGLDLYDSGLPPRQVLALVPGELTQSPTHAALIAALTAAGTAVPLPRVRPLPASLRTRASAVAAD